MLLQTKGQRYSFCIWKLVRVAKQKKNVHLGQTSFCKLSWNGNTLSSSTNNLLYNYFRNNVLLQDESWHHSNPSSPENSHVPWKIVVGSWKMILSLLKWPTPTAIWNQHFWSNPLDAHCFCFASGFLFHHKGNVVTFLQAAPQYQGFGNDSRGFTVGWFATPHPPTSNTPRLDKPWLVMPFCWSLPNPKTFRCEVWSPI